MLVQDKQLKRAEMDAAHEAKVERKRGQKGKDATQEAVEATATSTVRRGRKRKSTALATEAAESPGVDIGPSVPKSKVARVSNNKAAEAAGVPWAALVANMY
jgi:hypothetical protein